MDLNNQTERRSLMLGLLASSFGGAAFAQSNAKILEELARAALGRAVATPSTTTTPSNTATGASAGLSFGDADGGLRQALGSAALASAARLGRLDGYWADGKVQIPLPSPLSSMQARLKPLRLSTPLDNFQMRLNRAAETAAPRAGTIFIDTIKSLTISDAIQIVRGGDTAGTDMLKSRAGAQLTTLMTPPMAQAVDSSGAGAALDRINARYGGEVRRLGGFTGLASYGALPATNVAPATAASGPLIFGSGSTTPVPAPSAPTSTAAATTAAQPNSLKSQLIGFAVSKALDGLFYYVAEEERAIRRDPAKRTTDLLRRVFGGL
jgi:Protein of unknown function (DUF4197)